jgi:DNA-binding MarR family transcriptional regulator
LADLDKDVVRTETLPLMVLIDAGNVFGRALEKRLLPLNLGVAQQRILAAVYLAQEHLTPSMLAALLLQETHSVSGLLNRLEDRDLITRTHDRTDRRVVRVGLTTAGREAAEQSLQILVALAPELTASLGRSEKSFVTFLEQTRDAGSRIAGVPESTRQEALRRLWG